MDEDKPKVTFDWKAWWAAEWFGVVAAVAVSALMLFGGIYEAIRTGDWFLAWFFGPFAIIWFTVYCGGWHLLVVATLRLRARLGWITYRPGKPDQ